MGNIKPRRQAGRPAERWVKYERLVVGCSVGRGIHLGNHGNPFAICGEVTYVAMDNGSKRPNYAPPCTRELEHRER